MIRSDERDRAGEQGALSAKAGKLLLDQKTHCINTLPTSTTVTGQTDGNRYFFRLLCHSSGLPESSAQLVGVLREL